MSTQTQHIVIRTGGDPRQLPEFESIREEINKLNHPMQPEVNWKHIEAMALAVFRRNGVDLQTAVYYTLARLRLAGLAGFTEGCELLAGMITTEWERCWPDNDAARVEILDWFTARAGNVLRTMPFTPGNLRLLYRAERALQLMSDKLQQVPLPKTPRVENLLIFMQNAGRKVEQEKHHKAAERQPAPTETLTWMPGITVAPSEPEETDTPAVTVAASRPVATARWRWQGFALGMLCMLIAAACAFYLYVVPMKNQLAEVASRPAGAALLWLGQPEKESFEQQLERLMSIPPYAALAIGERSVALAQTRWPQDERLRTHIRRWQSLMSPAPDDSLAGRGYFAVQQQMQALNDRLLEQERLRGGLTISYLKTALYQMQSIMNADVPLEELLRQLESITRSQGEVPAGLLIKINARWTLLSAHYYQLLLQSGNISQEYQGALLNSAP